MGREAAQAERAAPHAVGTIKVPAHDDPAAGPGGAPGLLGELQRHALEADDVVLTDDAFFFLTEDLVEIDGAAGGRRPRSDRRERG